MSSSINRVTLLGYLGKDPELRNTQNGGKIAKLSVATSNKWTDKQTGELRERTEWHTVILANDALAGIAEKYLRKGSRCLVEGELRTRKWQDQQGQDRYATEVVLQGYASQLVLLDSRPSGQDGQAKPVAPTQSYGDVKNGTKPAPKQSSLPREWADDPEIPF